MTIVTAQALHSYGKCHGNERLKRKVLRQLRKTDIEGADYSRYEQQQQERPNRQRWTAVYDGHSASVRKRNKVQPTLRSRMAEVKSSQGSIVPVACKIMKQVSSLAIITYICLSIYMSDNMMKVASQLQQIHFNAMLPIEDNRLQLYNAKHVDTCILCACDRLCQVCASCSSCVSSANRKKPQITTSRFSSLTCNSDKP